MKTVDILVKTHPPDYDWLPYLFRSMARVRGYRSLVLLLEEQYPDPPDLPDYVVVKRSRRYVGTDYCSNLGAVMERLRAWSYTDAERIVFVDSDCVWSRDVDLQAEPTINLARPVVLWRTWHDAGPAAFLRGPAAETLGYQPPRETMVRYPFTFPREVLSRCWDFIGGESRLSRLTTKEARDAHPHSPEIYLLPPTDWNVLGSFAIDHTPDLVTPVNWRDAGPACVHQFWSHDRPTAPAVREVLGRLGLL
jgi:hypothetical protein